MRRKESIQLFQEYPERFLRLVRSDAETDLERLDYFAELDRAERFRKEQDRKKRASLVLPDREVPLTLEQALARLENVRFAGVAKWRSRCPVHQGRTNSLLVTEKDVSPGEPYFHCFAGCDFRAIRDALTVSTPPGERT